MTMTIILSTTSLFWIQLNQGIDTHNSHTRLYCRLQLLDLAHARLKYTCLEGVVYLSICEIETVVLVVL